MNGSDRGFICTSTSTSPYAGWTRMDVREDESVRLKREADEWAC